MKVNKWLDFLDRVGWTALQAGAGALLVAWQSSDISWQDGVKIAASAAGIAAIKVVLAQRAGDDDLGAAVPGNVLEQPGS